MENKNKKLLMLVIVLTFLVLIFVIGYFVLTGTKEIKFKIVANDGLQISADGINFKEELDKNDFLDLDGVYKNSLNQIPSRLGSISSTGGVTSGKLDMFYVNYAKNGKSLTAIKEKDMSCLNKDCKDKHFIAFDIFILAKEPKSLILKGGSEVKAQNGDDKKALYNAARVGFIVEGTVNEENKAMAQDLNGGMSSILWEPNYDDNKEEKDKLIPYKAIDVEIKESLDVDKIEGNFSFSNVNPNIYTKFLEKEDKKIVDLQAGITKLRIYLWVESQDVDMKHNSTTNNLDFNILLG